MIALDGKIFHCDECPIGKEGVEFRLKIAEELQEDPQLEYCWCDKVQAKHYAGGVCSDAFTKNEEKNGSNPRKSGRLYRRKMRRNKLKKKMKTAKTFLTPYWATETHIKYPKSSKRQKFWKRYANKAARKNKTNTQNGSSYKRIFDYAWNVLD